MKRKKQNITSVKKLIKSSFSSHIMNFENDKKKYMDKLYKPDSSTKGNVDLEISTLIDTINSFDCYYTTSSCSGRVILIEVSKDQRKQSAVWHYSTHSLTTYEDIKSNLKELFDDRLMWFVQEPLILHICANDIESAKKIVDLALLCGMKRSGIFSIKENRVMIEIIGCDKMEVPVVYGKKIIVDDNYIKILVELANEKMIKKDELNNLFLEKLKELKDNCNN